MINDNSSGVGVSSSCCTTLEVAPPTISCPPLQLHRAGCGFIYVDDEVGNLCGVTYYLVFKSCGVRMCHTVTCPVCEERIEGKVKPVTAKPVLMKLGAIQVRCPTCNEAIDRDSLDSHILQCPEDCPNGCREKVQPSQLEEHTSSSCINALVKCTAHFCTWSGLRAELEEHSKSCVLVKLNPMFHSLLETISTHEAQLKEATASCSSLKEQLALTNSKCLSLQEQVNTLKSELSIMKNPSSVPPSQLTENPGPLISSCLRAAEIDISRSRGVRIESGGGIGITIGAAGKCDPARHALSNTSVSGGVHYWEVTTLTDQDCYAAVGVVDGTLPRGSRIGTTPNSWAIRLARIPGNQNFTGAGLCDWHAS
ncbi:hypothetical protein Pelo_17635 [Pelomyxa schiedti]|nr:hypothetical protein Pelo_17635 [Pelomyxa schiedti]